MSLNLLIQHLRQVCPLQPPVYFHKFFSCAKQFLNIRYSLFLVCYLASFREPLLVVWKLQMQWIFQMFCSFFLNGNLKLCRNRNATELHILFELIISVNNFIKITIEWVSNNNCLDDCQFLASSECVRLCLLTCAQNATWLIEIKWRVNRNSCSLSLCTTTAGWI